MQAGFDLVIIDAPPRLTTGHVQAMCASTHVLIPTIMDSLSGDAVARYVDQSDSAHDGRTRTRLGANVKLTETERMIGSYARGLELGGAEKSAAHLQVLAKFLRDLPNRTMAELVECSRDSKQECEAALAPCVDDPTVADVIPHLEALADVLKAGRARAAQRTDLRLLIDLLRGGDGSEVDSRYLSPMLNALRQALMPQKPDREIEEFIDRLKAETGSDRFERVFSELANSGLAKEHLLEVARAVYGGIPKKTSRKAALSFIRKPHDAFMSAKRGIDATRGRSAA